MRLSYRSFVTKVAYSSPFGTTTVPKQTSLCPLFWRFVLSLVFKWPLGLVEECIGIVLGIVIVATLGIVAFPFGSRPGYFKGEGEWVSYKHVPTVGGHRILPVYPIALFALWSWGPAFLRFLALAWASQPELRTLCYVITGSVAISFVALSIIFGWSRICQAARDNSVTVLLLARLRAAKEKVCPVVTFDFE